jgi:CheY-like chemotaxis protein
MTILYIDDDPEDIEIFNEAIRTVDPAIQCAAVNSGKEALRYLQSATILPDHIFLDINMPGMDGRTCLEEIKKEPRFKNINVVIYSTNTYPKDIELMASMGAMFIKKANSFNDLCAIIKNLQSR